MKIPLKLEAELLAATPRVKAEQSIHAIRLYKQLLRENRQPNEEEKLVLVKLTGWGTIAPIFSTNIDPWQSQSDETPAPGAAVLSPQHSNTWQAKCLRELNSLLTVDELQAARRATLNAYQTSHSRIRDIWQMLIEFGFDGGTVLEPSCNSLSFLGCAPDTLELEITGVEIDPIPAGIAKMLYPDAKIFNMDFADFQYPHDHFDLVVGNVPFGSEKVFDPQYGYLNPSIHNYFLIKCCDLLRPGGIMAVFVSSFFMDATDDTIRKYLAQRMNLLVAARYPSSTFEKFSNTQVTADLVVFRKHEVPDMLNLEYGKSVLKFLGNVSEKGIVPDIYLAERFNNWELKQIEDRGKWSVVVRHSPTGETFTLDAQSKWFADFYWKQFKNAVEPQTYYPKWVELTTGNFISQETGKALCVNSYFVSKNENL